MFNSSSLISISGQVKNLPLDMRGYASKYLQVPGTYVVVERKKIPLVQKREMLATGCEVEIHFLFHFHFHYLFQFCGFLVFVPSHMIFHSI